MNSLAAKALFETAVALLDDRILAARGWVVHSKTFPVLDISFRDPARQELRLRMHFNDWNEYPPSVELLAPDGSYLATLPPPRTGGSTIFNSSAHERTKRPFVCMIGIREYHEHSSHVNDLWGNYKHLDSYTLGNIIDQLWNGWQRFWP
ncbi:MAG: hypothetical protein QM831_31560 [Kofleriaceae bacterium]